MKLFNTMTRQKEEFIPLVKGEVRIYSCGPTVYNYFHIGNARPFVTFDTLRRYFEYKGYKVIYVQNFTDIDDKMIVQANAANVTVRELADKYIEEYFKDADALSIRRASFHPRATETVEDILNLIKTLEEKGFAYVADDGVYFDIERFEGYGQLSNYNLEELEENASHTQKAESGKRNQSDFVLWKFKKEDEPFWESPWGDGRPGWHIECSAMSLKYLGEQIDIHCGGQDLIFPHHENEIAQSEAATGKKPFVRYWLHNGFINIDNRKMSKSKGNFFTVRDIVQEYSHNIIRFFLLSAHYRSPINFSSDQLDAAQSGLERIQNCIKSIDLEISSRPKFTGYEKTSLDKDLELEKSIEAAQEGFVRSMDDDLNTADAISYIYTLVRDINIALIDNHKLSIRALSNAKYKIYELMSVLGVNVFHEEDKIPKEVRNLSEERTRAKKDRDFARADMLRDQILEMGYEVRDTADGTLLTKI